MAGWSPPTCAPPISRSHRNRRRAASAPGYAGLWQRLRVGAGARVPVGWLASMRPSSKRGDPADRISWCRPTGEPVRGLSRALLLGSLLLATEIAAAEPPTVLQQQALELFKRGVTRSGPKTIPAQWASSRPPRPWPPRPSTPSTSPSPSCAWGVREASEHFSVLQQRRRRLEPARRPGAPRRQRCARGQVRDAPVATPQAASVPPGDAIRPEGVVPPASATPPPLSR